MRRWIEHVRICLKGLKYEVNEKLVRRWIEHVRICLKEIGINELG